MRSAWLLPLLLLPLACERGDGPLPLAATPAKAEATARADWAASGCVQTHRYSPAHGLGEAELVGRLGEPNERERFQRGTRSGEFYAQLEGAHPTSDPKSADVEISEWTWRSGDCRLTVWLHREDGAWRSFESLVWHREAEF
jgi:hypothetical protein